MKTHRQMTGTPRAAGTRCYPLTGSIRRVSRSFPLHRRSRKWITSVAWVAVFAKIAVGSADAASYAVNFDSQYNPTFNGNTNDYGAPYNVSPITGTFGPGAASQANWNNIHSQQCVNSYLTGDIHTNILDSNLGNPIALHVNFPDQYHSNFGPMYRDQGGNDGGGATTTDFQKLYNTGLRLGDVGWSITTDVAPYADPYDVYVYAYSGGKNYSVNQVGIPNWTSTSGGGPGTFVVDGNYHVFSGVTGALNLAVGDAISGFSIVAPNILSTAYWAGTTSGVWNANVNNFAQNATGTLLATLAVGLRSDVIFNADLSGNSANTTLGANTTIKSLRFASGATSAVGIGGGDTLTITPTSSSTGVTVDSGSGTHTISTNVALGTAQTWTVSDVGQTLNASGVMSGASAMTKAGAGTLVFSGNNSYSNGTTVAQGALALDYTVVGSKLSDGGSLTLASGTVDLRNGASAHHEVVASTTISAGLSSVTRSSGTSVLRMNGITPGLGVVNFGAAGIADTDTPNTNGILGGWATVAGTDWAKNSTDAADGAITAYNSYTDINVRGALIADGSTTNVRFQGDGNPGDIALIFGPTTINTLLQGNANFAARVHMFTETLATNGIMIGSGKAALTIGEYVNDGTVQTATAGGTLFLNNFSASNALTINAVIADNTSASSLATVGRVVLAGSNTYAGATVVNSGVLRIENNDALGTTDAGTTVLRGAALELADASGLDINTESLTLSGTGIANGGALRSIDGTNIWRGTVTASAPTRINVDASSLTLETTSNIIATGTVTLGGNGDGTAKGVISGAGGITKDGPGKWILSGLNTYTGPTTLKEGTLSISSVGSTSYSSAGNIGTSLSDLIFDGGTLQITGVINSLPDAHRYLSNLSTLRHSVVFNSGKTVGLDIASGNNTFTADQVLNQGSGGLTKLGAGTLIVDQPNTYTGITTIADGTLKAQTITVVSAASNLGNATSPVVLGGPTTSGTLSYTGLNATYTRGFEVQVGGGKINVVSSGTTLTISGGAIAGAESELTISGLGNTTITTAVDLGSANGSLTKTGTGVLNINSGVQTYKTLTTVAGATNVNAALNATGGTDVVANSNLKFGTVSQTLNSLTIEAGATVTFTSGIASSFSGGGGKGLVVTPEPGTIALLLVGALGVLGRRSRKSRCGSAAQR